MAQPSRMTKLMVSLALALSLLLSAGLALAQGPTVTATDPSSNAVGAALTQTIGLSYSQAISPATVHSGTLVAQGMLGGALSGSYSVSGQQVTLSPSRALFPNEIVRTTATSGSLSLSGQAALPYQWQFTAGPVKARCVAGFRNIGPGLTGVGNSSLAWGDYDNDGDLDIALAGLDSLLSPVTQVWTNQAGTFSNLNAGLTGVSAGRVAWGDYDNDGDLDLLLSGQDSGFSPVTQLWANQAGVFSQTNAALTGMSSSSLAWGDYDNDGDLDIALAGWDGGQRATQLWTNQAGTFSQAGAGLTGVLAGDLAWGDYDADGDLDIALTGLSDAGRVTQLWANDGGLFTDTTIALTGLSNSGLAWGDYDNDGDLDLLLSGSSAAGRVSQVWANQGGVFSDTSAALTGLWKSGLAWGDYDNDGDLDIALTGDDNANNPLTAVWANQGGSFSHIGAGLTGVGDGDLAWGDYDNDGDLDLLLAGYDSGGNPVTQLWANDDCPLAEAGPDQTVGSSEAVVLDGSTSGDPNGTDLSYGWTQSGGLAVSFSPHLSRTGFIAPAQSTILTFSLTITTAAGYTATDSTVVTVTEVALSGLSAVNDGPTPLGAATTFTATVQSGGNISYSWAFGDGSSGDGAITSHSYTKVGVYTATVTATNNLGSLSAHTVVTVAEPLSGLSAVNDGPTPLGAATTFTATVSSGSNVSYSWEFGDGYSGSGANPGHTYGGLGSYTATVTASNSLGSLSANTVVSVIDSSGSAQLYLPLLLK